MPADAETKFELLWQDMKDLARGEEETPESETAIGALDDGADEDEEGRNTYGRSQETAGDESVQVFV